HHVRVDVVPEEDFPDHHLALDVHERDVVRVAVHDHDDRCRVRNLDGGVLGTDDGGCKRAAEHGYECANEKTPCCIDHDLLLETPARKPPGDGHPEGNIRTCSRCPDSR